MATVELDSVTKQFGETTAVETVSLTVEDGETLGVVGPSGCGKTTTLRMLAGFETPTDGRVLFDGEEVTHTPPEQRNAGLVFQSYALFNNMTVRENVAFGPKIQGVPREERHARADELLTLLGIGEMGDRDPQTLSGGQQQRVGLARALAIEPHILLLDEPMTGLDAKLKRRLRTDLGDLLDELGVTALYVTHDQDEAMAMCDRIAVMNEGHLEQSGTPEEVYRQPANAFVADFVGTSNLVSASVREDTVDLGFHTLPSPANVPSGDHTAVIRPEAFNLGKTLDATILDRDYLGNTVRTTVSVGAETMTVELDPTETPPAGESVRLDVDPGGVHILR